MLRELVDQLLRRGARPAAVNDSNMKTSTVMRRFSDEPPILAYESRSSQNTIEKCGSRLLVANSADDMARIHPTS
ncbi:hypothetical protein KIN20_001127 [Parelaphostrongylus tenuis]|uniref:Uncharacterized protein n=1 Tax=Parelaphostrongylus tenuis TaxID=148309 RepID=A0AAD5QC16_PARTN|nr:hypothetical protein KIN20_001127 [Parelaphostrongylus tenuis]